ncbi:metal ABC transporter substrate-binding protein [Methanospirillum hungatei]|uniref:metal ABC transporter substrate-binding protein n=1 Tax=Methanospirillum hungatei TaxID=2203 RepID=UPI001EF745D4|nr:metal ABC transporter substrate-binding protein [Methanospirillum hungatei]
MSTTSVLWEPIQFIGGEKVHAIYITDPSICPHMQTDIVPNRMQMQIEFIRDADLYVAHNDSLDAEMVIPYIDRFMDANGFKPITWKTVIPGTSWNTPDTAKNLSEQVAGWLRQADPSNASYYESRLTEYLDKIDSADLTEAEKDVIRNQDVIVMIWQSDAADKWLGLNIVNVFGPDFYNQGQNTPRALVSDIYNSPEKYRNVRYIIENMQSEEMAKGVEEALKYHGINAKRVIFTNFPKSLPNVESLPDVLAYNKALVMPDESDNKSNPTTPLSLIGPIISLVIIISDYEYKSRKMEG